MATRKRTTKEDIIKLIGLWPEHTVDGIAKECARNVSWVNNIAGRLRKAGLKLSYKRKHISVNELIKDIVHESFGSIKDKRK